MTAKTDSPEAKKLNLILWIVGIAFTAFLGIGAVQMISFGEVRSQTSTNAKDIEKIQRDYLPYFAFEYIVESNNKLINILTAIDSKDDSRYQKAMIEWNQLHDEVIKQAGKNKTRSGGSSSMNGEQ